jgi:CRISPR/Cas system-associated protein Csm6
LDPDLYRRSAFGIGEPWPAAANIVKRIEEEFTRLNDAMYELVEAIEDHGIAMIELDYLFEIHEAEEALRSEIDDDINTDTNENNSQASRRTT